MRTPAKKPNWAQRWCRPVLTLGVAAAAAFAGGWFLGFNASATRVAAAPPQPMARPAAPDAPLGPEPSPDYSRRVVARLFNNVDITREELGEYMIARMGAEKLELLVNKKIVELSCKQRGVEVSVAEVEEALDQDCSDLGVDRKTFFEQVLRQYKKSLYEWKEDVIRPRLLLTKLCRDRVQVTEEDIHQAFESHYGEKVDVRILMYPKDQQKVLYQLYDQIRSSDEAFDRAARQQPNPQLAMNGGAVKPICRFSGNDPKVEKVAYSLRPGEVSEVFEVPEGLVIMKCVGHIAPDRTKIYENEREKLQREVLDRKTQVEVGKIFKELKEQAKPVQYLKPYETTADLARTTEELLNADKITVKQAGFTQPAGQPKKPQ